MRQLVAVLVALLATPASTAALLEGPNDADRGRDAPDQPVPEIWIEPGRIYTGSSAGALDADHYAIRVAHAGHITFWQQGSSGCTSLIGPDREEMVASCFHYGPTTAYTRANVTAGTWYLRINGWGPEDYAFSYGLDGAPAPPPSLTDDDAGSGHDAPDVPTPMISISSGAVHHAGSGGMLDRDYYLIDARQGDHINLAVAGEAHPCGWLESDHGEVINGTCAGQPPSDPVQLTGPGPWYAAFRALATSPYRFSVGINEPSGELEPLPTEPATAAAVGPTPPQVSYTLGSIMRQVPGDASPEAPAAPGHDPSCGGLADEASRTSGSGGASEPTLVWAALKTGNRAAIIWHTDQPSMAGLTYNVSGGNSSSTQDLTPRQLHLFVLDDLPVGHTLCFQTWDDAGPGQPHALRLANAMNDYDPTQGAYTINLLALSNEEPGEQGQELIRESFPTFASILRDATDGHVQAGRIILIHGDPFNHHSGFLTCRAPTLFVERRTPTCNEIFDVVYGYGGMPHAEGSTSRDGIQGRDDAIYMNNRMWDKTLRSDPVGMGWVLTHEMGHYAFGAMDLYTVAGQGPTCYDAVTRISVMGNNWNAREFDDEINRCPNEDLIGLTQEYVPTWTNLRERFPEIPERAGPPRPGPNSPGSAYRFASYAGATGSIAVPLPTIVSAIDSAVAVLERAVDPAHAAFTCVSASEGCPATTNGLGNDAGSGRDAGATADDAVPIVPGRAYNGTSLTVMDDDYYSFQVNGEAVIEVAVAWTMFVRAQLIDPSGAKHELESTSGYAKGAVVATPGRWFLHVVSVGPGTYGFAVGLDEAPPPVSPM